MAIRRKAIKEKVEEILDRYNIKEPHVPVEKIAILSGIQVQRKRIDDEVSGFLLRSPENNQIIIGVNIRHAEPRQRFTIAHELGHYMLHEGELLHIDNHRTGLMLDWRGPKATDSEREREANLFAAELLMPERFLRKDVERFGHIDLLETNVLKAFANRYKVSVQALTLRLGKLALVDTF